MKRILTMAMAACLVLSAGFASAKEMNFVGQFEHTVEWSDNLDLFDSEADDQSEDDFQALQRIRMYFQYIDSEALRGVVGFEIDTTWGAPGSYGAAKPSGGGQLGTDATNVEVKHAYTDFNISGVSFRVGLQGLAFPGEVAGSPIYDNDVAGIVANYQFTDNFGLTAGWARLWDNQVGEGAASVANDEIDAFTIIAPITMDGWSLTPWIVYAKHGENATGGGGAALSSLQAVNATNPLYDDVDIWWAGGSLALEMFDPFVFKADLMYGSVDGSNDSANDMAGWFFAAMATYKMDMVTPSLAFIYGTGEDDDPSDGSEVMPTLAGGGATNGGFGLTHLGFDGASSNGSGGILAGRTDYAGVALILDNFTFVEDVTHKLTIAYLQGTSDSELVKKYTGLAQRPILTDEDSAWEINFDTTYQIYENLALSGNFGYMNVNLDEDVWAANLGTNKDKVEDAYKFCLFLRYDF